MSERDKKLGMILAMVLLFGILGIWYPKAQRKWKASQTALQQTTQQHTREKIFIGMQPILMEQYSKLRDLMPVFPTGKSVDTYWLPIMDETARKNDVTIAQRAIGGEEEIGEVTELTLECRDWTGRLDALVHFLYDIETRKDAMMDIRQIYMKPNLKQPGTLQGSFTLNCAYMREDAIAK